MRTLTSLSWVELKLFLREPMTVLFSLALPLIILFILGGVFGNEANTGGFEIYRGVGAMSFYVPAYIALVAASVCLISIPTHVAGNRDRGVLKRFHASSVPVAAVAGAEVAVALAVSAVSAVLLLGAASIVDEFDAAVSVAGVIGTFLLVTIGFAAFGLLLGALLPTARSAQAVGMLAWFVMLFLGGAGPPPEVLTDSMQVIAEFTPLWHAVLMMQDAWLGLDPGNSWLIFAGMGVVSAGLTLRFFRWE